MHVCRRGAVVGGGRGLCDRRRDGDAAGGRGGGVEASAGARAGFLLSDVCGGDGGGGAPSKGRLRRRHTWVPVRGSYCLDVESGDATGHRGSRSRRKRKNCRSRSQVFGAVDHHDHDDGARDQEGSVVCATRDSRRFEVLARG